MPEGGDVKTYFNKAIFACLVLFQAVLAFNCGQSVTPNNVSISISPNTAAVETSQTLQFNAGVTGTTQTAVNWSIIGSPLECGHDQFHGPLPSSGSAAAGAHYDRGGKRRQPFHLRFGFGLGSGPRQGFKHN